MHFFLHWMYAFFYSFLSSSALSLLNFFQQPIFLVDFHIGITNILLRRLSLLLRQCSTHSRLNSVPKTSLKWFLLMPPLIYIKSYRMLLQFLLGLSVAFESGYSPFLFIYPSFIFNDKIQGLPTFKATFINPLLILFSILNIGVS